MKAEQIVIAAASVSLLLVALPRAARASEDNKLTLVTFSAPVSLPQVSLPAGTYRFELADPSGDRSVVRVSSEDGSEIYGTFLTIPAQEIEAPSSLVTLVRGRKGAPKVIESWFYPGEETGREFIYPASQLNRG